MLKQLREWRNFPGMIAIPISILLARSLTDLLVDVVLQNAGGYPLLPVAEKNYVDLEHRYVFHMTRISCS